MNDSPAQQIAAGLGAGPDRRAERRADRIAANYRPNPTYDRLLQLRDADSPRWDDLDRGTQLSVAMYENQRQIAREHGGNQPPTA